MENTKEASCDLLLQFHIEGSASLPILAKHSPPKGNTTMYRWGLKQLETLALRNRIYDTLQSAFDEKNFINKEYVLGLSPNELTIYTLDIDISVIKIQSCIDYVQDIINQNDGYYKIEYAIYKYFGDDIWSRELINKTSKFSEELFKKEEYIIGFDWEHPSYRPADNIINLMATATWFSLPCLSVKGKEISNYIAPLFGYFHALTWHDETAPILEGFTLAEDHFLHKFREFETEFFLKATEIIEQDSARAYNYISLIESAVLHIYELVNPDDKELLYSLYSYFFGSYFEREGGIGNPHKKELENTVFHHIRYDVLVQNTLANFSRVCHFYKSLCFEQVNSEGQTVQTPIIGRSQYDLEYSSSLSNKEDYDRSINERISVDNLNKLKWLGKPSTLAFLINELIDKGYIEQPLNGNFETSGIEKARLTLKAFEIPMAKNGGSLESLKQDFNKGRVSQTLRAKFTIPHIDDIGKAKNKK